MIGTLEFGTTSLSQIIESAEFLLSPYEIFPDCGEEHLAANIDWLLPRWYDRRTERLAITIQSFLIRAGELNILVDTCSGNNKDRQRPFFNHSDWPWLERLREAEISPADINIVLCSHLHVDHVGWNTRLENGNWVPTFPNARYLISKKEWEYWRSELGRTAMRRTGDYVTDSVLPLFSTGQLELISDTHDLAPSVLIEPAHGHTPGQCAVRIHDNGKEAILCADIMHHALQLRYPDWSTRFCADPQQARDTRIRFLMENADRDRIIFPAHFPAPTGGYIERAKDHYRFRFIDRNEVGMAADLKGAS